MGWYWHWIVLQSARLRYREVGLDLALCGPLTKSKLSEPAILLLHRHSSRVDFFDSSTGIFKSTLRFYIFLAFLVSEDHNCDLIVRFIILRWTSWPWSLPIAPFRVQLAFGKGRRSRRGMFASWVVGMMIFHDTAECNSMLVGIGIGFQIGRVRWWVVAVSLCVIYQLVVTLIQTLRVEIDDQVFLSRSIRILV